MIRCPNCKGSNVCGYSGGQCHWCAGSGIVSPEKAIEYAGWLERQAMDGAMDGSMPSDEQRTLFLEAKGIRDRVSKAPRIVKKNIGAWP